jgi:hypothetical protein
MEFTQFKFNLFRQKYDKAVAEKQKSFMFEEQEILTDYAKYVVEHLTGEFTKQNNQVEKAKNILENAGYFVRNLWHVDDVFYKYKCSDPELAQSILNSALTNEATMEQIWYAIDHAALQEDLEPSEDA